MNPCDPNVPATIAVIPVNVQHFAFILDVEDDLSTRLRATAQMEKPSDKIKVSSRFTNLKTDFN